MKATIKQLKEFVPFDVVLTVETEDDARALYHLFNHTSNVDLFGPNFMANSLRNQITISCPYSDLQHMSNNSAYITPYMTYDEYYNSR